MTQEGLENLKEVMRETIELQVKATLVMGSLQSIYLDEEDELDQDAAEHLRYATISAKSWLNDVMATLNDMQKAYGIEKDLVELEDKLLNKQDNDEARTE